jgi:hypothetical protein
MTWMVGIGAIGFLLLAASTAVAQPGIGITTTAPPPERRPPGYERPRPDAVRRFVGEPLTPEGPVFIGPTLRTETSEFGVSAWTAPDTHVGSVRARGEQLNGWASFGLTYTWGPPSAGRAIR